MKKLVFGMLLVLSLLSCTDNMRTRAFGGKSELTMKPNEELINITWKDSDMWVLTKDTVTNIQYFREYSSFGIFQGEIVIR